MKLLTKTKYLAYLLPGVLYAQTIGSGTSIPNPLSGANTLPQLLSVILNKIVMPVAAIVVVLWIIWAGFTYLTAQGNPKKIEEAHQRLLWALVGAGILLGAAGISLVIQSTVCSVVATGSFPCP